MQPTCETCGGKRVRYYGEYCPKCEGQPEISILYYYDLFKCLYYIEHALGEENFKELFWDEVSRYDLIHNDTYINLSNESEEENPMVYKLFEYLGIKEETFTFYVSW